jgi:hypothetical protein
MPYEIFERTAVRVETPTISITIDGRIAFNAAAVRLLVGAGVRSVQLLWDSTNSRIALKAAPKNDRNAYAVSIVRDQHAGSLRAKSFLRYIGWNASRRQTFPAGWNAKEKMLEAALPPAHLKPGVVEQKTRERK